MDVCEWYSANEATKQNKNINKEIKMERINETTAVSTEVVAGLGLEVAEVVSSTIAPAVAETAETAVAETAETAVAETAETAVAETAETAVAETAETAETAVAEESSEVDEANFAEENVQEVSPEAAAEEAVDADLEHESKLESRLVKAATIDESLDSLAGINAALRATIVDNGGDFQTASGIKHYNNIYKFLKRGEDFSLDMITSVAANLGFKIDIVVTKVDEEVAGLAETNNEFISAIAAAVNVVITEKFLSTKSGAKAQESEEKRLKRESEKAAKVAAKASEKAEKAAAKEAEKATAKAAKEAEKAATKAAKEAEKAANKAANKAAKDAAKAEAKQAEAAPVNLAEVDTIAIGSDLLSTPVAELAPAVAETFAETTELAPAVATPALAEAVAEETTEELVADDSGVSATDGINVNLADIAAKLNS